MDRRGFLKLSASATLGAVAGRSAEPRPVTVVLCGDVMTGRGVDQVLPHPGDPRLYESYAASAAEYVALAEAANGPISGPVDFSYIWGDALEELDRIAPDVRVINLETSVTRSDDRAPKGIHYRMHPDNVPCITAAGIDCCVLANNHVLDWGRAGLVETLQVLRGAGVRTAGAGRDAKEARAPATLDVPRKGRVLVFSFGSVTSGIPRDWAASEDRPGVQLLEDLSSSTARRVAEAIRASKRPGDVVIASIHWGENWGYEIPSNQRAFAHRLIDEGGVAVVHGHSSHHPKGIEIYRDRAILYGCGDFINDYEGIRGYEEFRDDLVLMYLAAVDPVDGSLVRLEATPLRVKRFRLSHASAGEARRLRDTLARESGKLGTSVELRADRRLVIRSE